MNKSDNNAKKISFALKAQKIIYARLLFLLIHVTATCANCNIHLMLQRMSVRRRVKWAENVRRGRTNFMTEKLPAKNNLRDLGIDVRLILKWVLEKRVVKYVIWIKSTEHEMCFISLCSTGAEHLSL
jgi:hypothetical protein